MIDSTIAPFNCYMWGGHDHVSEMLLVLLVLPYFFYTRYKWDSYLSHNAHFMFENDEIAIGRGKGSIIDWLFT